jgi:HSP20 family protein
MTLMRFDPFRELDRLADQALISARTPRTMPMEAFRRGDQFIVAIDVPGVNQDDVGVTVERNVIELSTRRQSLRQAGDEVIIDERPQGEFRRQLFLGDNLDPDKLTAQYDRGVLRGAAVGALTGALIGWIFGLFNWLYPLIAGLVLACYGAIFGTVIGALTGLVMYAFQAGRRDFTAVRSRQPRHFDVVADVDQADRGAQLLSGDANQRGR